MCQDMSNARGSSSLVDKILLALVDGRRTRNDASCRDGRILSKLCRLCKIYGEPLNAVEGFELSLGNLDKKMCMPKPKIKSGRIFTPV